MNELREDRYADPALNALQAELKQQLDFSGAEIYLPQDGDPIYTFDVQYLTGKVQVGIDIVIYPELVLATETGGLGSEELTYVPGYFSFYEGPAILEALATLTGKPAPKLIIVDGHGQAHPRKFGLACFVGIFSRDIHSSQSQNNRHLNSWRWRLFHQ